MSTKFVRASLLALLLTGCGTKSKQAAPAPATLGSVPAMKSPEDIEWKLTELQGAAYSPPTGLSAPNLKLDSSGKRVTAFGGVNRIAGAYQLDGSSLKL